VRNATEDDRALFWLMFYAALATSLLVFAVAGRFVP
jgi:hypothetical protein